MSVYGETYLHKRPRISHAEYTTNNLLQDVDDDLRALTAAIKSLEAAQIPPNLA